MSSLPSPNPDETPDALLAEYIARAESGESIDTEELCRAHPQHAARLRSLHAQVERLKKALKLGGADGERATKGQPRESVLPASSGSFAARLEKKYGEGVDPEVSLDEGPGVSGVASTPSSPSSTLTDDLVRRLAQHGLKESRYKLEGEVARGGMGAILKVWDEDLRRHLAMKVVLGKAESPSEGGTPPVDSRQLARFLEEAQVTGQLDHPGIVPVHELGLDNDGRVYFTMKLVKGRDLKRIYDLVAEGKDGWNETRALSVILKACEAMAYAHTKGVIHRDLKPANVMVGHFGEVYVMDWGLARVLGRKDAHDIRLSSASITSLASVKTERRKEREEAPDSPIVTMDGDVMGTPAYMPPEQARGEVEMLSPRSDVYSIGAMLYQLLARQMPYVSARMRVSNRTVLALVIQGPPAPLHALRKDVPAELAAICEKAMARDASKRYPDTLALAEDLRAFLEHRVVHAYETGALAELKKWIARNRPLAAASAAALVIALGGLTWVSIVQSKANTTIRQTNVELDAAKKTAETNEILARQSERVATQRADDVLSLSAIQDLQELIDRADALWPAYPENIGKYTDWLRDAHALIEGNPGDPALGIKKKLGLAEHKARLAELRARALPLSAEELANMRAAHPRAQEFDEKLAKLVWMSHMLGATDPTTAQEGSARLMPARATQSLPIDRSITDANELNSSAWPLVSPTRTLFGGEGRALELAQRAVEVAKPEERAGMRDSLAWALLANARFDEALAEEKRALDEAPPDMRPDFEGYRTRLEGELKRWTSNEGRAEHERERAALSSEVSKIEGEISARQQWSFADAEEGWWHVQLSKLIANLESFADPKSGLLSTGTSRDHGWGVEKRTEFARTIDARSVGGSEAKSGWQRAIASIRHVQQCPKYAGLVLAPQIGLVPIGPDPDSGLWEFAHLQTGEPAQRGPDGKLVLKETTGVVLVLIPGGSFELGAQRTDPSEANYDPRARADESPVNEVTLAPYFLSKYEMTQGQWLRFVGSNPSQYYPDDYDPRWNAKRRPGDLLSPVEQVSWTECSLTLERLGLVLPTEAQWERGARAETDTPWWTGRELASLAGAANLSDRYSHDHQATWPEFDMELDDGNSVTAAVGSYKANGFGLYDVHGNVWEWCRDAGGEYKLPVEPGTGERQVIGSQLRVSRGGGFGDPAAYARSASRSPYTPEYHLNVLGLRPARSITP